MYIFAWLVTHYFGEMCDTYLKNLKSESNFSSFETYVEQVEERRKAISLQIEERRFRDARKHAKRVVCNLRLLIGR